MTAPSSVRPVPGFEALVWSGEHVGVEEPRAQRVRIARVGNDEALLVYATRVHTKDVLWSRHLRGAFTRWPPEVGPAVEHQSGEFYSSTGALMAWPDGSFAVRTREGTIVANVGEPGAKWSFPGYACFEPAPLEGMYLFATENEQTRVFHRSRRAEEAHVTPCGVAPTGAHHHVVTELGTLLMASFGKDGSCQLFVMTRSGVTKGAKLEGPEHVRGFLLARRGGGAFVVLTGHFGDIFVQRVNEEGQPVGERFIHAGQYNLYAACAWNDGFALEMRAAEGLVAVVSDGAHATPIHAAFFTRNIPMNREGSLVSSANGSVILFAYDSSEGLRVGRLVAGGPEVALSATPPTPSAPWESPLPVRQPAGPPAYLPPKLGTRDDLLRRLRRRAIGGAISRLRRCVRRA